MHPCNQPSANRGRTDRGLEAGAARPNLSLSSAGIKRMHDDDVLGRYTLYHSELTYINQPLCSSWCI